MRYRISHHYFRLGGWYRKAGRCQFTECWLVVYEGISSPECYIYYILLNQAERMICWTLSTHLSGACLSYILPIHTPVSLAYNFTNILKFKMQN